MSYSKYQEEIFKWIEHGQGHAVVMARAGSGKTYTIEHALKFIPRDDEVLFLAFNKHIADELKGRIFAPNVEIATLNSFGWRVCRESLRSVKMSIQKSSYAIKDRIPAWKERVKVQGAIERLIGLRKATWNTGQSVEELASKFDVDLPDNWDGDLFEAIWDDVLNNTKQMDFDDQIFMPIYQGWKIPQYDWVFVDEAQDLSPTQIDLVAKAGKRIVAVGDDRQAIYGFRGADPEAINNIIDALQPTVLPLNVCYRCPSNVLDEARKIVPDIEDAPGAIEGIVTSGPLAAVDGDYVLCRTTAPLVGACLKMIAAGEKATVKGRDIGQGLIKAIKAVGAYSIEELIDGLDKNFEQESSRLRRQGRDTTNLEDRKDCLDILILGAESIAALVAKIESIFTDAIRGVVFCTVHRAKGLQADNIWILCPELMPFPKAKLEWQQLQEMNLKYVAITRAQRSLTWVTA